MGLFIDFSLLCLPGEGLLRLTDRGVEVRGNRQGPNDRFDVARTTVHVYLLKFW